MTIINQKSISGITSITTAAAGDNLLTVHTNDGSERLRITSDGKVGINTDMGGAPASLYPFSVYRSTGTGYVYTETAESGASAGLRAKAGTADFTIFTTQGTGQLAVYDNTNTAERLRITSDGKIGIGNTTSPTADLEVAGTTGTASTIFVNAPTHSGSKVSQSVLKFGYAHSGSPNAVAEIKLIEDSVNSFNGNLTFGVPSNNGSGGSSTSEALRIKSNGNIGIGTVNPSSLLHLNADATALRITRGSSIGFLYNAGSSATSQTRLQAESGSLELYTNSAQPIKVIVNGTEEARFLSGGGLTFNGDTAQANALDDYEEGTWTPSISGATFTTAEGLYTKIGRQVLIQFNVATLSTSLSAADRLIGGLPFTAANVNQVGVSYIGDVSGVTYSSGYGNIYGRINASANQLQLLQKKNDGSTHTTAPALGTGLTLRGYAWYSV